MRYVIIGNSAAGISAAENLRRLDSSSKITLLSDENERAYSRCLISRFVDGRLKRENLYFKTKNFYQDHKIETLLGYRVTEIDRQNSRLVCENSQKISYDRLLISTGSSVIHPNIKGLNLDGVCEFHSVSDAEKILSRLNHVTQAVVIGAGIVGLEAACALAKRGIKVKVVEKCSQILPSQFDAAAGEIILKDLCKENIKVVLNESVTSIDEGNHQVCEVTLADGTHSSCELVILATGVRPNSSIAHDADLNVDRGVLVDDLLRTEDPNIFAAGDVTEIDDMVTGKKAVSATWYNAAVQGRLAAYNMVGRGRRYTGAVAIQNAVEFHEIPAVSFGITQTGPEDEHEVISLRKGEGVYQKLVLKDNRVCGMVFVGDISKSGLFAILIKNQVDISKVKDKLLEPDFSYAYFKDLDFGEKSPYLELPSWWESSNWWILRAKGIYA